MKNLRKILSIILIFILISSHFVSYAATTYTWDLSSVTWGNVTTAYQNLEGLHMPYKPADKYISEQNAPDFSWPYVYAAEFYELGIYKDEACTQEYKLVSNLKNNYYNFNVPLETGVDLYWRVRYFKKNTYSVWSDVRRFKIDPDATEFLVPDTETLINRVSEVHPKVFVTPDTLADFRNIKNTNDVSKATYDYFVSQANIYRLSDNLPLVENITTDAIVLDVLDQMYTSGFAYLLTGDKEIGKFAKKALLLVASIDYEDVTNPTSYVKQDQRHRECMYKGAMVYDWVYDLLTDAEKLTVQKMIVGRATYDYSGSKESLLKDTIEDLKKNPYDSHAWTAIGYIGITAYVLKGDVDEAEDWLREFFPLYISAMHPWSNEDGGWSQGTYYWTESTNSNKYIMDVLKIGGVFDLYNKVWVKNEVKWVMYTYPKGSYGSFGDAGGRHLAEDRKPINSSMLKVAYFMDDPLARWISNDLGTPTPDNLFNYYVGSGYYGDTTSPSKYAYSNSFKDVGWAVMTSDLEDPDRVQLTFKSGPYGSFNHSNADQNSFFIQAFGEKLAIRRGYYDSYNSAHHANFSRASFAHNTITINGDHGQVDSSINAKGNLSQFVSQLDFDSVTGEAAEAYNTSLDTSYAYADDLDRFDRNIIYIRPDVFVVIDDLKAAEGEKATFEWYLNAEKFSVRNQNNSATISQGNARLTADVLYPSTTYTYYSTFKNQINGTTYTPTKHTDQPIQTAVKFKTAATDKTKMVVSMSVYKADGAKNAPEITSDANYQKLVYNKGEENETTIIVNLQEKSEPVTVGDITFKGTAVTYNADSIMLTNGTYLEIGDKEIINADRYVTVALGHGQICISSDDDYNIALDSNNDYLAVSDITALCDDKGRAISSQIGVSARVGRTVDTNILTLSAQKGNYTILNGDAGIISPSNLVAEDVNIQKTTENKAALFWNNKKGRDYQLKLSNGEIIDLESMPYTFDVTEDIHCMYIRENLGGLIGEWSEPIYISKYESEKHDKVVFGEKSEGGKKYITASTMGLPSYGFFNMYLAKFDGDKLIGVERADANGYRYATSIEKGENLLYKAFILGKNEVPLATVADHNADSTDLLGIYIDGELIDEFDNTKDRYEITFEEDREIFPYVTAEAKNNTSMVDVDYNFDCLRAIITVTAADGETREIVIQFKYPNIHIVDGATDINTQFSNDSKATISQDIVESKVSRYIVTKLSYKDDSTGENWKDADDFYDSSAFNKIYTNMRANKGGMYRGSRVYSDRYPYSSNQMEISDLPEELEGYDYFVFKYPATAFKSKSAIKLEFDLDKDADIVILTKQDAPIYENAGFKKEKVYVDSHYTAPLTNEDLYYNIDLLKVGTKSDLSGSGSSWYLKDFDNLTKWFNVTPKVENTYTYAQYQSSGLTIDDFSVEGTAKAMYSTNKDFIYKYTKTFKANTNNQAISLSTYSSLPQKDYDVSIEISHQDHNIIVIKPKALKPFN